MILRIFPLVWSYVNNFAWSLKNDYDQVYKSLSIQKKADLLSQVAFKTFELNNYFFKQKQVEEYIADYIRNLPDTKTDLKTLQFDSESILKSIEAKHGLLVERARGIYSFSHLTFQEYFTARECVANIGNSESLQKLVSHITEKRWREVFLLAIEMLDNADEVLLAMRRKID